MKFFLQEETINLQLTATDAINVVKEKLVAWLETAVAMIPNLLVALAIMFAFVFIGKLVKRGIIRLSSKVHGNKALVDLFASTVYIIVLTAGLFIALSVLKLDKTVTSLLAGAGILGIALGFAFQDSAANFLSGIMIAIREPYKINDLIEAQGYLGTVDRVNLRTTVLRTVQGQEVIIPNRLIYNDPIKNYTASGRRRVDLAVGVSYGEDLERVSEIAMNAIEGLDFVEEGTNINVHYNEFGDSSINFTLKVWIKEPQQGYYNDAQSDMVKSIKKAFDNNDIVIPFPIRTLDFGIKGGKQLSETKIAFADRPDD
ncbi:MAG: mechanosensitive ion channel family protein [Chitinophagales bacterium]|nr:mechanosensitive ion channel family protein [Chitinophagales bacterium]